MDLIGYKLEYHQIEYENHDLQEITIFNKNQWLKLKNESIPVIIIKTVVSRLTVICSFLNGKIDRTSPLI